MKIQTISKKVILVLVIAVISYITFSHSIKAQENALPIGIFPAIQDLKVHEGDKARMQIQIKNGSQLPLSGAVRVADYIIRGTDGTPLLLDDNTSNPKFGAAQWIKPAQSQITIPPNDFVTVDLAINVPQVISNCGHYAIVYFQPNTGGNVPLTGGTSSATTVISKIGGLINLQVDNIQCKEGAQITNFQLPTFIEHGPIPVAFNVYNQGDLDITPKGTVSASNIIGSTTSKSLDEKRIFPETAKEYKINVGEKWMFGRYKVAISAQYGLKSNNVETMAYIWIIPWKELSVLILAIIIIVLLINRTMRSMQQNETHMKNKLEEEETEIEKLKEELRHRDE